MTILLAKRLDTIQNHPDSPLLGQLHCAHCDASYGIFMGLGVRHAFPDGTTVPNLDKHLELFQTVIDKAHAKDHHRARLGCDGDRVFTYEED